jgi:predicted flavoprotein YhiN
VKALAHFELTKKSAAMFLEILNIDGEKKAAEVNKKEINKICNFLKAIPLQIVGRGAGDEFVTAGGINLKEIDQKTMQSKLCPGAYFVGEVLNVDGFTGGFNLSASWAAGFVAGKDVVEDS